MGLVGRRACSNPACALTRPRACSTSCACWHRRCRLALDVAARTACEVRCNRADLAPRAGRVQVLADRLAPRPARLAVEPPSRHGAAHLVVANVRGGPDLARPPRR